MPGVLGGLDRRRSQARATARCKCAVPFKNRDGSPMKKPPRQALATDKVRYRRRSGRLRRRRDAGRRPRTRPRRSMLDIEPLPAVTDARDGRAAGRAAALSTTCPATSALDFHYGDSRQGRRGLRQGRARHAARADQQPHRRQRRWSRASAIGDYDTDERPLHAARRQPGRVRPASASWPTCSASTPRQGARADRQCRRLVRHEGAGLSRICLHPARARSCSAGRSSGPTSAPAASSPTATAATTSSTAELALDTDGNFLAVRLTGYGNLGGYLTDAAAAVDAQHRAATSSASTARR